MLNRLNPVVKCLLVLIPAIVSSFQYNMPLNLLWIGLSLVLMLQSRVQWKKMVIGYSMATLAAIGVFMTGFLYQSRTSAYSPTGLLGQLSLTSNTAYGAELAVRVICFASLGMSFSFTTNMLDFVSSLEQQVKLPAKFSYGILAAFHLVPVIPYEFKKIRQAFLARGIKPFLFSPQLLTPFLIKAVRWSESLAIAMESRGFDEQVQRSRYRVLTVKTSDWICLAMMLMITVLGTFYLA